MGYVVKISENSEILFAISRLERASGTEIIQVRPAMGEEKQVKIDGSTRPRQYDRDERN